jgi:hypothetical protein
VPGRGAVANAWRICRDDGGGIEILKRCWDTAAPLWRYAGIGQWNDPGMLVHLKSGMTQQQVRTQVMMAAILPSPLMIGIDVRNASAYLKETLLNEALIAVNQDKRGIPGRQWARVGGTGPAQNDHPTSPSLVSCAVSDTSTRWQLNVTGDTSAIISNRGVSARCLDIFGGNPPAGSGAVMWECVRPNPTNALWSYDASTGQLRNQNRQGLCFTAPSLTVETCSTTPAAAGQKWNYNALEGTLSVAVAQGTKCLSANHSSKPLPPPPGPAAYRVWGRPLATGAVAIVVVNYDASPATIVCEEACFTQSNFSTTDSLVMRDLWTKQELQVPTGGKLVFKDIPGYAGAMMVTVRRDLGGVMVT